MHLGQKVSIHSLSAHGEKVIFCEKRESGNCANRYVHELKIICKVIVPSQKFPSKSSIAGASMWMHPGDFMSPKKIWSEDNVL
jgi:hypothetical protein